MEFTPQLMGRWVLRQLKLTKMKTEEKANVMAYAFIEIRNLKRPVHSHPVFHIAP